MPLRNRVNPFGEIVAVAARGTMLGNRGILHNEHRTLVRTSQSRRWICCMLEWKQRRRTVMTPHTYTELFFLDEATAFAAGTGRVSSVAAKTRLSTRRRGRRRTARSRWPARWISFLPPNVLCLPPPPGEGRAQ